VSRSISPDHTVDLVAAGDFDADGRPELALGSFRSRRLRVVRRSGAAESELAETWLPDSPLHLAVGDFDGDGRADLAAALQDQTLAILLSSDDLQLAVAYQLPLEGPVTDLRALPTDDGSPDLVLTAAGGKLGCLEPPAGSRPLPRPVSSAVKAAVDSLTAFAEPITRLGPGAASLSQRERQVVELALAGLTARGVGERLFIGERTVETHLARAYIKLGVRSRLELLLSSNR